jgi:iron(III) transport system permease protein
VSGASATAFRPSFFFRAPSLFGVVAALLLCATLLLIAYPIGMMLVKGFVTDKGVSGAPFLAALTSPGTVAALVNTAFVVTTSCLLALIVGAVFAWLHERTDANIGFAAEILPLVPLLIPQIAGVTGWVTLLSPQAGFVNAMLRWVVGLFGVEMDTGPINIFSYPGLIGVMTLYLVPYVYLIVSASLQQLNPSLEEASRISGASPLKTLLRITLPAIRPALINAGIIVLIFGISMFSVPIVIGTGASIDLLAVEVYRLLYNYPPHLDQAIALSIFMMLFIQAAVLAQVASTRTRSFAVISGKGQAASRVTLGRWRLAAQGSIILYLLATAVLPLLALILVSLQPFWSSTINIANLSLQNFVYVISVNQETGQALFNSVMLGIVGATLGMIVAAILVTYARSAGPRTQAFIEAFTALPATIPQTVLAIAIVITFSAGVFNLHGTLTILVLAYFLISLPQSMRSARVALAQVGDDLIEASQMAHASKAKTFFRIILPLMRPGLIAGWVILFIFISGELTASALLAGTSNPVVGLVLLDMWENGSFPQLAAVAVIMTMLDIAVVSAILRTFKIRNAIS